MIRLDKYLCQQNVGTRSQVKELLKKGKICVNQEIIKDGAYKISEPSDTVSYQGEILLSGKFRYYMLNKPAGVVTATQDSRSQTVMDLLDVKGRQELFPVGRLDKDTEGLLLITNDGELAHRLLSPRKHVPKTYSVTLKSDLTEEAVRTLTEGTDIGDGKKTLPAKVEPEGCRKMLLTITEGRFHQVKRMAKAVGNEVLYLKRLQMGSLKLDECLKPGDYRELTAEEIAGLKNCQKQ